MWNGIYMPIPKITNKSGAKLTTSIHGAAKTCDYSQELTIWATDALKLVDYLDLDIAEDNKHLLVIASTFLEIILCQFGLQICTTCN